MRPPAQTTSTSTSTAEAVALNNGSINCKAKNQFESQTDLFAVSNRNGSIHFNYIDSATNPCASVTSTTSSSISCTPGQSLVSTVAHSSSITAAATATTAATAATTLGHVKNALRAERNYEIADNIINANNYKPIDNVNKCLKFSENAVSNANAFKCNNDDTQQQQRHCDSQQKSPPQSIQQKPCASAVDSYHIVNNTPFSVDSRYSSNYDQTTATTTTSAATSNSSAKSRISEDCEQFVFDSPSEYHTETNYDSEISPLLERNESNSIALVKNKSASLIFTKKEFSPVVHRKKEIGTSGFIADSVPQQHQQRRSLQFHSGFSLINSSNNSPNNNSASHTNSGNPERRKHTKSWYASIYSTLDEFAELDQKEPQSDCNLACTKKHHLNGSRESASLLENHQPQPQLHQVRIRKASLARPTNLGLQSEGPHVQSIGGPSPPKYNRFEQLLKTLVGRKVSKEAIPAAAPNASAATTTATAPHPSHPLTNVPITTAPTSILHNQNVPLLLGSPDTRISRSPSEHTLIRKDRSSLASTTSLNHVQQRLWSVMPLLRREGSCTSLHTIKANPLVHQSGMKKCETVLALTRSSGNLEPIKPLNRLRSPSMATCSRCSSLLSLAANGSRYSLNLNHGNFIPIGDDATDLPTTSLSSSSGSSSRTSSTLIATCKLCLADVQPDKLTKLTQCGCEFCTECMKAYVEFEITEGAYEISCPDALCPAQGALTIENEISKLVSPSLLEKHQRYRLNREVELDQNRTWCPRAGCETVCLVDPDSDKSGASQHTTVRILEQIKVRCPSCVEEFCSGCKKPWHIGMTCDENARRLAATGVDDSIGIPFDSDLIKCCPMCAVPIEKDEGCAQMMCKRCKHVFCWYCLASLDDDFLLRHYDKGPCKNKLGHSRASVVWHRAQVIGIFAGFGILLLVASPLLLLAAPCIVCCRCRICTTGSKLEDAEADFDEPPLSR